MQILSDIEYNELMKMMDTLRTENEQLKVELAELKVIDKATTERIKELLLDLMVEKCRVIRLKDDNARMRKALEGIINEYDVASDGYFCLNCGGTTATHGERCSRCGADLLIEHNGFIAKVKQALNGGE